jgi:hypothetical protein
MTMRGLWALAAILASSSALADFKPEVSAMIKDIEQMEKTNDDISMVFWFPTEYWRVSLQSAPNLSEQGRQQFTDAVDPYLVVAVLDGKPQFAGAIDYTDAAELRNLVWIEDRAGNRMDPLEPESISIGVKNVVDAMHPIFTNMLGPLGAHLQIFTFSATGKDGKRVAEATKDGALVVHLGSRVFHYRLPLGSLLPPMMDAKTGESFPGNYHFNPFNGDKLSASPAK